jgi:pimeloyl-ACP methyl ester carboxylesterase
MAGKEQGDPFASRFDVPVAGGELRVARAGPPAHTAERVVLAVHGVTASLMTWLTLARELDDRVCLLAPDLRGRGRSAALPGPYGMTAHITDLLAVLDHVDAPPAVLVGHSMGAYIVERLAADHPERAAAVVLLDAGLPFELPDDPDDMVHLALANTTMRLSITFPSAEQYILGWQAHPAFMRAWSDDIAAYARYDVVEERGVARCNVSPAAVRVDTSETLLDDNTRLALERVHVPVQLLRAERGMFDEDPLIPRRDLHAFAAAHPSVLVEDVPGVNHYTLVMGASPGPARVAAAIERAAGLTPAAHAA